ncbi:MAG TPA: DnaB-like helicase C-terminal domain-containing protein [Deinococcales bacterium]|nr:DnaB-like helicase C-terminal domain-containing protein [Deinococcales bacterium]
MNPSLAPHNLDAEAAVLGAALLDPFTIAPMRALLPTPDRFYGEANRLIWEAMIHLDEAGVAVDARTLENRLSSRGNLERIGGLAYLAGLPDMCVAAAYAEHYAGIVADKAARRDLVATAGDLVKLAGDADVPMSEIPQRALSALDRLRGPRRATAVRLGDYGEELIADLMAAAEGRTPEGAVPFGLPDLDRAVNPMEPGTLSVVAARPGIGKSALALQVAHHAAVHLDKPALILSLEMKGKQLLKRAVALHGRAPLPKRPTTEQIERAQHITQDLARFPLYIVDDDSETIAGLRAAVRDAQMRMGATFGLIVVDYLQIVETPGRNGTRENEVASISRGLLKLARELNVPILALAQLSRASEGREDTRPKLTDLRESGQIEQDASLVIGLWREATDANAPERATYPAEAIVLKQRDGRTGTVPLLFNPSLVSFQMPARL